MRRLPASWIPPRGPLPCSKRYPGRALYGFRAARPPLESRAMRAGENGYTVPSGSRSGAHPHPSARDRAPELGRSDRALSHLDATAQHHRHSSTTNCNARRTGSTTRSTAEIDPSEETATGHPLEETPVSDHPPLSRARDDARPARPPSRGRRLLGILARGRARRGRRSASPPSPPRPPTRSCCRRARRPRPRPSRTPTTPRPQQRSTAARRHPLGRPASDAQWLRVDLGRPP